MLLFSNYLKQQSIDSCCFIDKTRKDYYLYNWLNVIFSALKPAITLFPEVAKTIELQARKQFNKSLSENWTTNEINEKIKEIDKRVYYLCFQLTQYAKLQSFKIPLESALLYPYKQSHAGVSMCAYIVLDEKNRTILDDKIWEAHDALQNKVIGNDIKRLCQLVEYNLKESFLSNDSKKLITSRCHNRQFHAEDYWFSLHLNSLINIIKNINSKKNQLKIPFEPMDDDLWLPQLFSYPRIEFIMTSSSCEDCQSLFSDFRTILNKEKIFIPIVIFANTPYNRNELATSPVALIKFDTSYFATGIAAKMPYFIEKRNSIVATLLVHGIFSREEVNFSKLENIMNTAMLKVITAPIALKEIFITRFLELFYYDGTLNEITFYWFENFLKRFNSMSEKLLIGDSVHNDRQENHQAFNIEMNELWEEEWPLDHLGSSQEVVNAAVQREINSYFDNDYSEKNNWLTPFELGMTLKNYYQSYACDIVIQKDTLPYIINFSVTARLGNQPKNIIGKFDKVFEAFPISHKMSRISVNPINNQIIAEYDNISLQSFNEIVETIEKLIREYRLPYEADLSAGISSLNIRPTF